MYIYIRSMNSRPASAGPMVVKTKPKLTRANLAVTMLFSPR